MLSRSLRLLERDGLVTREVELTTPVTITLVGRELLAALRFLIDWAGIRLPDVVKARRSSDLRRLPIKDQ